MNEHEIERAAARLGDDVQIDVDGVAQRVVAELQAGGVTVPWWRRGATLRAAAAVVVLVTGGVLVERITDEPTAVLADVLLPVGLDELSADGLTEMLDSLDMFTPAYELQPASFDELDEEQLRELLTAMEG
jgi:hypothetical protein